jgi:hypothetical protein
MTAESTYSKDLSIPEGKINMSTTTERIKEFSKQGVGYQISVTFSDMGRMAELLERAASYIKQGKIKFAPNTTNADIDVWLADFERFQKGE